METLITFLRRARGRRVALTGVSALVSILLLGWTAKRLVGQRDFAFSEPRYLITRRALPQGNPANFLDLTLVPKSQVTIEIPAGALTDQDLHLVKGATFREAVAAQSILTISQLHLSATISGLGSAIPKGYRAYSLRPGNALKVGTGDRIDVLVNPPDDRELPVVLAEGVSVLQAGFRDGVFEVVAAVTSEEVELLEKGKQRGKLNIALRNPQETSRRQSKEAARLWLQRPGGRKPPKKRIEVWAEDR